MHMIFILLFAANVISSFRWFIVFNVQTIRSPIFIVFFPLSKLVLSLDFVPADDF